MKYLNQELARMMLSIVVRTIEVYTFDEKISKNKTFTTAYLKDGSFQNSDIFGTEDITFLEIIDCSN